jgi:hypothetical protein
MDKKNERFIWAFLSCESKSKSTEPQQRKRKELYSSTIFYWIGTSNGAQLPNRRNLHLIFHNIRVEPEFGYFLQIPIVGYTNWVFYNIRTSKIKTLSGRQKLFRNSILKFIIDICVIKVHQSVHFIVHCSFAAQSNIVQPGCIKAPWQLSSFLK